MVSCEVDWSFGAPKEEKIPSGENAARKRRASAGDPSPPAPRVRPHPVAHLDCADHGGPADPRAIDEMVFWSDIPADASYLSPMHPLNDPYAPDDAERFLTFEPDSGGWNNVRMAMETALVLSHATGRTLVLPPEQRVYLLNKGAGDDRFSFKDFFHLDAISIEHRGFKVITMEEFLVRVAKEGRLKHPVTQRTVYPPGNQTDWGGGGGRGGSRDLFRYLRSVGNTPEWDPWECALAIPSSTEPESIDDLNRTLRFIMQGSDGKSKPTLDEFNGHPTPVNATMRERMREMLADRNKLCIYDKPLRESALLHLKVEKGVRLLTHFYAFVFFADWRQDLWSKRFVRDHLRYVDEIVCAAARVVEAVRERSRENARKNNDHYNISNNSNNNASRSRADDDDGVYDAMHVRRGDFQYPPTQLPADKLYDLSKGELEEGATLYVATDERNKGFFDIFKKHFDVVFLDDFASKVIPDVNPNYYGMIDQLVAYKSRVFYGTWWSTLSGYVNRMRGYYIAKHKLDGYKDGTMRQIESDIIAGDLNVEDIPQRWNADMKRMLGVDVENDADGCLQDMHWSALAIGYFPTYLIGAATAAQLEYFCRKDFPNFDDLVEKGEFAPLREWLTEKVHKHGSRYESLDAMLEAELGEKLNPKYFIKYLTSKYSDLYGLD